MGSHSSRSEVLTAMEGIRRIVQVLRASSRAAEKRLGLSGAQLFVLSELRSGQPLSVGELAARTFTHQSSASVVVSRLCGRRLLARRRSTSDGRRTELWLTDRGRATVAKAPEAAQGKLIAAISALPAAERRAFAKTLDRIHRALGDERAPSMFFEEDYGRA